MSILITGASGFIGAHLSRLLISQKKKVVLCDNFSDYYSVDLKKNRVSELLSNSPEFVAQIDLLDRNAFKNLIDKFQPTTIIHLAAQPGVRLSFNQYEIYLRNNILAFNNVLAACVEHEINNLVYASSSSVYHDSSDTAFNEKFTKLGPRSFYGLTKKWNEEAATHFSEKYGIRTRGLRFFTAYGPWGRPDMAYFRLMASALKQHDFTLFGDGSVKRDFTFIDDVCLRIDLASKELSSRPLGYSDVVNIGGQSPHSMLDLIRTIEKVTATKLIFTSSGRNDLDLRTTEADKTYGNSIFGDTPYISLEQGVNKFYNWARRPEILSKLNSWIASTL